MITGMQTDAAAALKEQKPKKKWDYFVWDTLDKSKEERWFMFKLDAALLTFASLGYFIKYLDQSNINNAFVSGMKEDLGLYGNQFNYMQTCWTVGYVIGQVPSNMILTRVRPRIWIPAMELTWAILTFCLARANTAETIYALRFLIGLAESSFYPGMQYIIGSWYRRDELAKRSCIFHTSSAIATMFSGYLMAAVYHLDGRRGLLGWQWLFIVDGVISLPIAVLGFCILPDVPEIATPFYLSGRGSRFCAGARGARATATLPIGTKAKMRKILTTWHIYALTPLYVFFNNGSPASQPVFQQFLKASTQPKYTVSKINTYPTTTNAVQVVTTLAYAWTSDSLLKGARWPPLIFGGLINMLSSTSLAIWNIPMPWKWACYILSGFGGGLSGICMALGCRCSVWQQVDAPQYPKGFITVTLLSLALIVTALITRVLHGRELAEQQQRHQERRA
ncbi:hypothetical protein ACEQ8H_008738 [Pleosporales sp. CAS-2024a]